MPFLLPNQQRQSTEGTEPRTNRNKISRGDYVGDITPHAKIQNDRSNEGI